MNEFIVANWKSNKTEKEALEWMDAISKNKPQLKEGQTIILCPSFPFLAPLKSQLTEANVPFQLGVQDISSFGEGAYTGAVNGAQLKEYAAYCLIGHSERRKNFGEDKGVILKKLEQCFLAGLLPIICVSQIDHVEEIASSVFEKQIIIAYEPLFAIGSGLPDTPQNANDMATLIKEKISAPVLYGGSVTSENVKSFTGTQALDGVLVGKSSLSPDEFSHIIQNA